MKRTLSIFVLYLALAMFAKANDTLDSAKKLIRSRDYASAVLIIDNAIKTDSKNAEAFYLKAYVLEKQDKIEDALAHYAEAKDLADRATPADAKLAKSCGKAIARLDKARAVILDAADALERRATLYKSRDPYAYGRIMKVVWQLRSAENADKRPVDKNVEETIRCRYMDLFVALAKRDLDKALNFVDPEIRQKASDGVVKGFLGIMAGAIKVAKLTPKEVGFESVTLGKSGDDAKVVPVFTVNGRKDTQKPGYWVKRNGKWYLGDEKKLATFK